MNLLYVAITRAIRAVELPASSRDWLLPEGIEQDNEPEVMPEPAAEQEPLNYYQAMERLQALVDANEAGMLPQPLVVTEARRAISFFHEVTGR
ncbi:hypothetical protein [Chitinimonas koreensis]|uniref:hypothetical protein n=1 Tax=Chitinimonas koreensis TaxID=356302 RepID=UPI001654481C|nr:hypothetical protein [Chitinimonas koreensis]QNM95491.1 hypothetical protein H9L41_16690 [Chitinimonas koreensis]